MPLEKFRKADTFTGYVTNDRYWFENNTVEFWYRLCIQYNTFQDIGNGKWITKYDVILIVDDECVHENHRDAPFPLIEYGFMLKNVKKKGQFDENIAENIVSGIVNLNIENKIKVRSYQKIKGILNGGKYTV